MILIIVFFSMLFAYMVYMFVQESLRYTQGEKDFPKIFYTTS